jgi:DNA-binding protein H-NS
MPVKLSYVDMQAEIAKLQKQADALRLEEKLGVVGRIKEAIGVYGLTRQDLFDGGRKSPNAKQSRTVQYADGNGNTWGGRGPRPQWLRDALGSGKSLEDYSVGAGTANARSNGVKAPVRPAPVKATAPGKATGKVAAKFKDGAGNTWSGRGLQPRWLKAAIEAGKSLEDFRI